MIKKNNYPLIYTKLNNKNYYINKINREFEIKKINHKKNNYSNLLID